MTAFQDVQYSWNFGDSGASGSGTWPYGSNPGVNRKDSAIGGVAAHLYLTSGVDQAYTVTVTATDGVNTASCQLGVTAYDPSGPNGFTGTNTTCVSASTTPVAGSGGCPAGAGVLRTSSFNVALKSPYFGSGKRVLFRCGDTFTGDNAVLATAVKWSIGAYGGCEGTQTGRPVFNDTAGTDDYQILLTNAGTGDGRISDIDFEGNGTAGGAVYGPPGNNAVPYQITLWNLYSNGNDSNYSWSQGAQWGLVGSVATGMRVSVGNFVNFGENNPSTWSGLYPNDDYQAIMGNLLNGSGNKATSAGEETMRASAGRYMTISNNTIENANAIGAVLKIHDGNPSSSATWSGVYVEYVEISDNLFTGSSGAQLVEVSPQDSFKDERLRNIVVERNLFEPLTIPNGRAILVSAVNTTLRDNVFYIPASAPGLGYGVQVAQRGIEPAPQYVELYNNTCYFSVDTNMNSCIGFNDTGFGTVEPSHSVAKNNLYYQAGSAFPTVLDLGSQNTVSNNTVSSGADPAMTDASGDFSNIADFRPTANDAGAAAVPVFSDALGSAWGTTWSLGAVHP